MAIFIRWNILAHNGKVTGVIDWVNVVVAPAEMDVGSAIANIATVPFGVPPALRFALRIIMARILARYQRTYAQRRELDGDAVRYFQVFRCVHQLTAVLRNRGRRSACRHVQLGGRDRRSRSAHPRYLGRYREARLNG